MRSAPRGDNGVFCAATPRLADFDVDFSAQPVAANTTAAANTYADPLAIELLHISPLLILFLQDGGGSNSVVSRYPHQCLCRCTVQYRLGVRRRKAFNLRRDVHRTEFRAAHRAEMGILEAFLGERLVVHGASRLRIEGKLKLAVPVKFVSGAGKLVIPVAGARTMTGNISGMSRNFIRNDTGFDVLAVWQPQVLLGRDVAKHGRAVPADHGRTDGRGDVVIAGSKIRNQRTQRVKRSFRAHLHFFFDLKLDLVQGDVAGTLDHHLNVVLPGFPGKFAQRLQLGELCLVAGIGDATGAQAVAERKADVVFLENFADVVEALVEHILLVVFHHPFGQDGSTAADDSGNALGGERYVLHQDAAMDGHVVNALLGLFLDDLEHDGCGEVLHATHARERFINRHSANGNWRGVDDGLPYPRNVAAGGQIHHRVGSVLDGVLEFLELPIDVRRDGGVADVGVDLTPGRDAD